MTFPQRAGGVSGLVLMLTTSGSKHNPGWVENVGTCVRGCEASLMVTLRCARGRSGRLRRMAQPGRGNRSSPPPGLSRAGCSPRLPPGLARRTVADHLRHFLSKAEEQESGSRLGGAACGVAAARLRGKDGKVRRSLGFGRVRSLARKPCKQPLERTGANGANGRSHLPCSRSRVRVPSSDF